MWQHWEALVGPIMARLEPHVVIEIGIGDGANTGRIASALADGSELHAVDPAPGEAIDALEGEHAERLTVHRRPSLSALGELPHPDLVLIDGDHNWYTVHAELELIERLSRRRGERFPAVILHDIDWPYGRRDRYDDPAAVPDVYRHPHRKGGVLPGRAELADGEGLNADAESAIQEHQLRNGVRTALEDFLDETSLELQVSELAGFYGAAVVLPEELLATKRGKEIRKWLRSRRMLATQLNGLESHLIESRVRFESERRARLKFERREEHTADRAQALEAEAESARERARRLEEHNRKLEERSRMMKQHSQRLERAVERAEERAREGAGAHRRTRRELEELREELDLTSLELRVAEQRLEGERRAEIERVSTGISRAMEMLDRAERSRSWRMGHALALAWRRLTFRPPVARGSIDQARKTLAAVERALPAEGEGEAVSSRVPELRAEGEASEGDPGVGEGRSAHAEMLEHDTQLRFERAVGTAQQAPAEVHRVPLDPHGSLHGGPAGSPSASVVVCVHDALEETASCLGSLLGETGRGFELIVIDDGSGPETRAYLERFAGRHPAAKLIVNDEPPHGYTVAANLGLAAAGGDYVVLLNSDTIVTPGWLDRIIACGESDPALGVIGPLSNAATHQSIPEVREAGAWATNPPPAWLSPCTIAFLVALASERSWARVPFLNGFCFAIKRRALEQVGDFDAESFPDGYGEENDFCIRTREAGLGLAIADDAYIHHAKSSSYGTETRAELSATGGRALKAKHGDATVRSMVEEIETDLSLTPLRKRLTEAYSSEEGLIKVFQQLVRDPLTIRFVLPGLAPGGGGGAHSIYQEVRGLQRLGVDARALIPLAGVPRTREVYPDADRIFIPFSEQGELEAATDGTQVLIATHHTSAQLVAEVTASRPQLLGAYYVQDYEPLFAPDGTAEAEAARASYSAFPHGILFAKTDWLCDLIERHRGVPVHKVSPSLDRALFHASGRESWTGPVRVAAMLRPRTPRRQAVLTARVLEGLRDAIGSGVKVHTFGCDEDDLAKSGIEPRWEHHGLLSRQHVSELLRTSDLFLDASTYQAFGRTGLEAMACGCVPVLPLNGGAGEFARDRENARLVDTLSPDEPLQSLRELVEDEGLRARLQEAALESASRYSEVGAALSEYAVMDHARATLNSQAETTARH